jgi:hypothetical protein
LAGRLDRWKRSATISIGRARSKSFRCNLLTAQDVALYARTKQELATQTWAHVQDYATAKQGVIAEIMARAAAWRSASDKE